MKNMDIYLFCVALCAILWCRNTEAGAINGTATGTLHIGVLIPWSDGWALGPSMGSAIGLGISEVTNRSLLAGYSVDWKWKNTRCEPFHGLKGALDLWEGFDDIDAFIGGGCSDICKPVSLVAAAWNLPFVSFGCTSDDLSDKTTYPTFTRTVGTWLSLAPMISRISEYFEWERIGVVTTREIIMERTADAVEKFCNSHGQDVYRYPMESPVSKAKGLDDREPFDDVKLEDLRDLIRQIKREVRVVLLLMYDADIQASLLAAYDEGMLNGDYVFMVIDGTLSQRISPKYRPTATRRAYEGLLSANLRKPSGRKWDAFAQRVIDEFQQEPRFDGFDKLAKSASISEVDAHAGMLHDAVLMWAYGVNMSLAQNPLWVDDGLHITEQIRKNLTFEGITGTVATNSMGDRKSDYTLAIAQGGEWVGLLDWHAADERLVKVYLTTRSADDWAGIAWAGNTTSVPRGRPACGWRREYCKSMEPKYIAAISVPVVILGVALILSAVGYFGYRHYKHEAGLKRAREWKCSWSELTKNKLAEQIACSRAVLKTTKNYATLAADTKRTFAEVADYKGKTVYVKRVNKQAVNFNDRFILTEVKQAIDMQHDNVNLFVGACIDAPNISILMEYAQKGSLQDVMQNSTINLNWELRTSLAMDIANGMNYLHQSPIHSHGHLTSHNCVVDSRWVCKITDYGLGLFKAGALPTEQALKEGADLLWTAPELLRMEDRPMYGTQDGDVYSYAIILQEIIMKDAPFFPASKSLQPVDILERVRFRQSQPYRPSIPTNACSRAWAILVEDCWTEEPDRRPPFPRILAILKEINGGKSTDIVQNMIRMLEQHSEHLEEVAAGHLSNLNQANTKVQTFLQGILPQSIVKDLLSGNQVAAETFGSVTIFVVSTAGFNTVAATMNASEVIKLLQKFHSMVDEVAQRFKVYKLDYSSNSVMFVSGAPQRFDEHAGEIATMALHIMSDSVNGLTLVKGQAIKVRIGIHSGPVVSGLIGLKIPKFTLFGDAVEMAVSMESSGLPGVIHVSSSTAGLLEKLGGYQLESRGVICVEGKGEITTHWLTGKSGFNKKLPDMS